MKRVERTRRKEYSLIVRFELMTDPCLTFCGRDYAGRRNDFGKGSNS